MDLKLDGQLAIVTGSTAGIGRAIAARLLREGCRVAINGRTPERVRAAAAELRGIAAGGASVIEAAADVGTAAGCEALTRLIPEADILVNNAGVFKPTPFGEISDAEWMAMLETNVMSGVRLSRHYLPRMLKAGRGRIVFISSESGVCPPPEMLHYGMSKTAQLSLSRGLAQLCAGTPVTVNALLPGPTGSEGVGQFVADMAAAKGVTRAEVEADFFRSVRPNSLLKRFATVEEIADMAAFIVSPLASATNGAALRCEGGIVPTIV